MGIYEPYIKAGNIRESDIITPRPEQTDAIERAFKYFKRNEGKGPEFLWNAKMRFGKTVCALWLIERLNKELGKKKVLIVTHRPVVNASWYGDFKKIFKDSLDKYSYGTSKETDDESSLKGFNDIKQDAKDGKCVLFFVSMQYLRLCSLVGGRKDDSQDKKDILSYGWDLVIIDEAHEGTQTDLGEGVINYLHKDSTFLLYLSGTPFNLLEKFKSEQIYNWDYIKEQQYKRTWDEEHEGKEDLNPYRELPRMEILTFRLSEMTDVSAIKDAATSEFSFAEFFRVKTGHDVPHEERGKFLHEAQVRAFIHKLCQTSEDSYYPFSNDEYRKCFRHTLWVVPGVKEAQALKRLLETSALHTKLGFKVINVAGNSDDDEQRGDALDKVLKAIGIDKETGVGDSNQTRTITLSCGRLTTGVTVRPWTAVLYLKGSDTTSASTYMQTIFRVQSPHIIDGMMKSTCYVFDFAPERALTMMAETAKYSRAFERKETKGEKKQKSVIDKEDKEKMKELLAECPIYETTDGSPVIAQGRMVPISGDRLFGQLNKVYVDKVVRNGFDHPSLYNNEALINPDLEDESILNYVDSMFEDEKASGAKGNEQKIEVNHQELTAEQRAIAEREEKESKEAARKARLEAEKKNADKLAKMTEEEREMFLRDVAEKARKRKLVKQNRDKLQGLSKRIPLMMYGANVKDFKDGDITIEKFTDPKFIDDESWNEFMPKGMSRDLFRKLSKFYNADIFKDAGIKIRQLAREADSMKVEERIARIAQIFKWFKNPDKETVLTPWEVVNRHLSSTLGGYCFFEDDFKTPCISIDEKSGDVIATNEPRFVDQGDITKQIFGDGKINAQAGSIDIKVLEINSKTGLYPLYVAYSLYRRLLPVYAKEKGLMTDPENYSADDEHAIWDEVVKNNLYVICNTKMAERITRRTLIGFRDNSNGTDIELHVKQDKLIARASDDKKALIADLLNEGYWTNNKMNKKTIVFDAVVGNPPYQVTNQGNGNGSDPLYHKFIDLGKELGRVETLIHPARFLFNAGKTPKDWNKKTLGDPHFKVVQYIADSSEVFQAVDIKGGIAITLWDRDNEFGKIGTFSKYNELYKVLNRVKTITKGDLSSIVAPRELYRITDTLYEENPSMDGRQSKGHKYSLGSNVFDIFPELFTDSPAENGYSLVYGRINNQRCYRAVKTDYISHPENFSTYKVIVAKANGSGEFGEPLSSLVIGAPYVGYTDTFISIGCFGTLNEAEACKKYIKTKFSRALLSMLKVTHINPKEVWSNVPIQDFSASSDIDWSKDIAEIDQQLYDKYNLTSEERGFIEEKVKPMD